MGDFVDAADDDVEHYAWGEPPFVILNTVLREFQAMNPGFELSEKERALVFEWTGVFGVLRFPRSYALRAPELVLHATCLHAEFRCNRENSQPMYRSWIPSARGSLDLTKLPAARRALIAILLARAARAYNWGVCTDGAGNSMFRYFTTLAFFHDFAVYGMLPEVGRTAGDSMHDVFSSINRELRGAPEGNACVIVIIIVLWCCR